MRRTAALVAMCVLLLGAACGKSKSDDKKATTGTTQAKGSTQPETRTVKVDSKTDKFNGAFLTYFPNDVTVRPGDTVEFDSVYTGEPHTVTMGTLVETCLKAAQGASPDAQTPPECKPLPTLLPEGPGDAHQNAAQPCYLETGNPPSDADNKPCAKGTQPAFTGRQTYYNSGFLPDGAKFKVKLADNITPGAYRFYCNLHGPEMAGTINVKPVGSPIDSAQQVEQAGKAQLDALVAKLAPGYEAAKAGKAPAPFNGNLAGFGSPDVNGALVNEFLPATIKAKVNAKVTWTVVGPHTISFGVPGDLKQSILEVAPDGAVHQVQKAGAPSNSAGMPDEPPSNGPPTTTAGPPKAKAIDGGTFDGSTFKSSGVVLSFPPAVFTYSVTFTKAGSYTYQCLIHPGMAGVVTVT